MSTGGLSKVRLGRMHDVMASYVERGDVPGLVTLVSRRGEVHVDTIGAKAVGGSDPIRRDTIFRVASMTKPIAAAATMILVEECRLRLDEPVDRLLPELAGRKVLKRLEGPLDETVPANRPITVRDLLTFRMGFGQLMAPPDAYPILKAANEQRVGMGPPTPSGQPWRRFCVNASLSRSAWRTLLSACPRPSSTDWRPATRSILKPGRWSCMTRPRAASGAARPHSRPPAVGWSRPSTTIWPSAR